MIGKKLLHYEIIEMLGEGGMGVVYKARDTHLDRFVALKLLPPEKVADPERKARFIQEAKAASALNHGNIVTIHDIASDQGTDFIAMEYVAGKTLDQIIPKKGLPLREALKIVLQIASALARAHSAGIVHRDLKPSNVIADAHGGVKLLDFGLAKLTEPATSGGDATTAPIGVKTEEGTVVGTVAYMSPEQAQGRPLDGRSDIFSFGAVLYEMLAGRRAFQGPSKLAVLTAVLREEPPALPPETPAELAKIVQRCLRKDPDRRFQHMDDVQVALQDVKEDSDSGKLAAAAPASTNTRRTLVWAGAVGALVVLLAIAGWFLWPQPAPPPTAAATPKAEPPAPPLRMVPLTANPGFETDPCFSPDGNRVAYSWNGEKQDNADIYVKLVGPGDPLRLTTDPSLDLAPAWSPDDKWIAFLRTTRGSSQAAIMLVPPLGGRERKIGEISVDPIGVYDLWQLTWTKRSKELLVNGGLDKQWGLFLFPIDGGEIRRLKTERTYSPALSPNGRQLVYVGIDAMSVHDLYLLDLASDLTPQGDPIRLTEMNEAVGSPAWTDDGREIVFSSGGHMATRNLWRIAASPGSTPRKETVGDEAIKLAVSRDGRRLVYAARVPEDRDIWRLEVRNRIEVVAPPAKLIFSIRPDQNPAYSPNGKQIAFNSHRSGHQEVWVANADGTQPLKLTSVGGPMVAIPRWSPDGRTLAVHSMVGEKRGIDLLSADGGALRRAQEGVDCTDPTWSRDGLSIYFGNRGQVCKVSRDGGAAIPVTVKGGSGPAFESMDGEFLYYRKGRAEGGQIWRRRMAQGEESPVLERRLSYSMNFALVDDGLYLIAADYWNAPGELCFFDFATQRLTKIIPIPRWHFGLTVSPDGRFILYSQKEPANASLMLVEDFR